MTQASQTRSIPMEQWCALAREGAAPPVTILLEGDSMRPLIRRGRDPVTIVPLTRPPERGDVVLFRLGERYIVHRVWQLDGDRIRTFGDNCWNPEPWFPVTQVLGRVIRFQRGRRTYRLDTTFSQIWGRAWMALHPVRMVYKRLRSLAGRCFRKFFPKKPKGR